MLTRSTISDRFAGALLGTAFGDALGAAVEGWTADDIRQCYGEVRDFIDDRLGAGCYTDDTQLTLATARSIVRMKGVDAADCARACVEAFDPQRGYGRSAIEILQALRRGADYRKSGALLFPEGSYGNGAAMRIAPVGLVFGGLPPAALRLRVRDAVWATHVHDEAIDGALIVAAAVGRLSRLAVDATIDGRSLLQELALQCRTLELRSRVMRAASLLDEEVPADGVAAELGNGVRTLESVPTALYAAMRWLDDPEQAVVCAVGFGGDADTIAAMTGALVGARHGAAQFPERWHRGLERGSDGYDALVEVSLRLCDMAE